MSERTPVLRLLPTEEEATDPGPRCPGKREEELLRVCVCACVRTRVPFNLHICLHTCSLFTYIFIRVPISVSSQLCLSC